LTAIGISTFNTVLILLADLFTHDKLYKIGAEMCKSLTDLDSGAANRGTSN